MNPSEEQAREVIQTPRGVSYVVINNGADIIVPRNRFPESPQPPNSIERDGVIQLESAVETINAIDNRINKIKGSSSTNADFRQDAIDDLWLKRRSITEPLARIAAYLSRRGDAHRLSPWQRNNATVELEYTLCRLHERIVQIELMLWGVNFGYSPEAINTLMHTVAFVPVYRAVVDDLRARQSADDLAKLAIV